MPSDLRRTDVAGVFRQHEILLTGVNGFLGKVLLGLILDRLPDFRHLHILSRPTAASSAQQRFYDQTLLSPALRKIADKARQIRGDRFLEEKITVWEGDISENHCGLNEAAIASLSGRIGAIVNCAGLVEFFPPVDEAFASNVDGVENVVALARETGSKLLHVSTCYVCGQADGLVEETEPIAGYYPHRQGPEDSSFNHAEELAYCRERIRQMCDPDGKLGKCASAPPEVINAASLIRVHAARSKETVQRLIALGRQRAEHWGWMNTYTYSKSLGEQIIAASGVDYAIVRPPIVESALRFPFPGWIEGGRTAAPLVLMALGGLQDWPVKRDLPLEVVPVDLVAAAILVVAALLLDGRHEPVYQLGSAEVNPVEAESVVRLLWRESARRARANGRRWAATAPNRSNGDPGALALLIERFTLGWPPALRSQPRFVSAEEARGRRKRLQERIERAQNLVRAGTRLMEKMGLPESQRLSALSTQLRTLGLRAGFREQTLDQYLPFVLQNRYIFECENIRSAYSLISEKDRELLPWDPERIDWDDYWTNHQIKGIETWVQPEVVKEWNFRI